MYSVLKVSSTRVYVYCSGQMISIYIHQVYTEVKCSNLSISLLDQNWTTILVDHLSSIGLAKAPITLTFSSGACRFAILPPQQQLPDDQIKQFLFEQLFKKTFPGFDPQHFTFVCDELIFDQPCLVVALPKALHESLQVCASKLNVVDTMPSILRAWQYFSPRLTTEPMHFVEEGRSFRITHDGTYPTGIFALPQGISSTQQQTFDVSQPWSIHHIAVESGTHTESDSQLLTLIPPVHSTPYSPQQAINLMSAGLE